MSGRSVGGRVLSFALAAALVWLGGCTSAEPPASPQIIDPDGGARTQVIPVEAGQDAVRLVLVRAGATLYRTPEGDGGFQTHPLVGRTPQVDVVQDMALPPRGFPMQVEADLGDRLKVSTSSADFGHCWAEVGRFWEPLDLVLYVDRDDLVEVTTAKVVASYPDGGRVEVWPGAALEPTEVPGRFVAAGSFVAVMGVPSVARGKVFTASGPDLQSIMDGRPYPMLPVAESGWVPGSGLPLNLRAFAGANDFGRGLSARDAEPQGDETILVTVGDACVRARLRVPDKLIPAQDNVMPRLFVGLMFRDPDPMEPHLPRDPARALPCDKTNHDIGPGMCQTIQRGSPAYWEDGSRAGTVRQPWLVVRDFSVQPQPDTGRRCYRFYRDESVCFDPEDIYWWNLDGTITTIE